MHTYQSEPDQVLEITFSAASAAADAATASSCSLGPPPPSIIPRPSPLPPVTSTLERLVNGGASGGTRAAWLHVHSHPPTRTHRVYLAGNHAASDGRNGLAVLHTFLEELGRAVVPGAGGAPGAALVRSSAGGGLLCGGGGLEEGPASSATTQPRSPPPPPPRRPPIPDAFLPRPAGPVRGDGSHWATALATAEEDAQRAGTGAPSAPFAPPLPTTHASRSRPGPGARRLPWWAPPGPRAPPCRAPCRPPWRWARWRRRARPGRRPRRGARTRRSGWRWAVGRPRARRGRPPWPCSRPPSSSNAPSTCGPAWASTPASAARARPCCGGRRRSRRGRACGRWPPRPRGAPTAPGRAGVGRLFGPACERGRWRTRWWGALTGGRRPGCRRTR